MQAKLSRELFDKEEIVDDSYCDHTDLHQTMNIVCLPSAMAGMRSGRTNEANSIEVGLLAIRRFTKPSLSSRERMLFSFCRPSRGVTSWISAGPRDAPELKSRRDTDEATAVLLVERRPIMPAAEGRRTSDSAIFVACWFCERSPVVVNFGGNNAGGVNSFVGTPESL